jgi:peptidyl-prolyl cis-trans isomerase B (cyclophilin B)
MIDSDTTNHKEVPMERASLCRVIALAAVFLLPAAAAFAAALTAPTPPTPEEVKKYAGARAVIETRLGKIVLKFYPDKAPIHVKNFITLAESGFYDGTVFHRVIQGFMIQGGDPKSKDPNKAAHGTGGPGYTIKAEFNDIRHKKGILSMARMRDPDSAGSQFFIMTADAPHLDGQYTAFGEVVEGLDTVDKIVAQPKDARDNPMERVELKVKITYGK